MIILLIVGVYWVVKRKVIIVDVDYVDVYIYVGKYRVNDIGMFGNIYG